MKSEKTYISSIYNHCDRWCERCKYTAQCELYSIEIERTEKDSSLAQNDMNDFAKELHKSFADTVKMIEEYAKKFNLEISSIEKVQEAEQITTPLSFLAAKYFIDAAEYLKRLREEIKAANIETAALSSLIPGNPGRAELLEILECFEIIQWYHTMIPVKIERAHSSATKSKSYKGDAAKYAMRDADGSAYVAYKSVLKLMIALGGVHSWTQLLKEETLNLIIDAGRIKILIEKELSGALTFVWPPQD